MNTKLRFPIGPGAPNFSVRQGSCRNPALESNGSLYRPLRWHRNSV